MDLSSTLGSIRIYKKGSSRIHNKVCYFPFATYLENTIIDWWPNPLNQKLMCEGMAQTKGRNYIGNHYGWKTCFNPCKGMRYAREEGQLVESSGAIKIRRSTTYIKTLYVTMNGWFSSIFFWNKKVDIKINMNIHIK